VRLLRRTLRFTTLIGAAALVWALTGPLLAPWLFGTAYADAMGIGRLLCLRYVIALVVAPLGLIGYGFGLARYYWRVYLLQAAVVATVNFWLLPRIGPVAAAWALIAHESVGSLLVGMLLWRACRRPPGRDERQQESAP
jgi:O-antigen/teichoic acid export membrane protein